MQYTWLSRIFKYIAYVWFQLLNIQLLYPEKLQMSSQQSTVANSPTWTNECDPPSLPVRLCTTFIGVLHSSYRCRKTLFDSIRPLVSKSSLWPSHKLSSPCQGQKERPTANKPSFFKGAIPRFDSTKFTPDFNKPIGKVKLIKTHVDIYLFLPFLGCKKFMCSKSSSVHTSCALDPRFLKRPGDANGMERDDISNLHTHPMTTPRTSTFVTTSHDYNKIERYNYTLEWNKTNSIITVICSLQSLALIPRHAK